MLEAENGKIGLDLLIKNKSVIAAVILDLVMPVMDGYGFLEEYSKNTTLTNIPVIVSTENSDRKNEKKALSFGAWDFISKPYDVDIINFRLHNCIKRTELALFEKMKYMAEYDELTGLYNRTKFYEQTRLLIDSNPEKEFIMVRFDINKFSLLNSFYGKVAGDRLLKYIAEYMKCFAQSMELCTYGRINADVFAFCCNYLGREATKDIWKKYNEELKSFSNEYNIVASIGLYIIDDRSLTVEKMYDRAALAAKKVKGNYVENYCFFEPEMLGSIESEQVIINEMEDALEKNQFTVYFQPKYDIKTNKPAGAEGLVRWIHPTRGLVSPGVFIPVFEQNGFIMKLDYYVWESACRHLRKWLDEGIIPLPVSINVSRVNLYSPNLSKKICDLVDRYKVPHELFQIEITESIYSSDNNFLDKTLKELEGMGFTILMDDFGSGYSSLNVLKDVSVNVLKIDMKFMQSAKKEGRAEIILAIVVEMAQKLKLPVIAEGVETGEQVELLRNIGCEYVQGYYFARPMPAENYETLIREYKTFVE